MEKKKEETDKLGEDHAVIKRGGDEHWDLFV